MGLGVCLHGGDGLGWALDEDCRLMAQAAGPYAEFTSLERADIVHGMFWRKLLRLPDESLRGKRILCTVCEDPLAFFADPQSMTARRVVSTWIARSSRAVSWLDAARLHNHYVPYLVDPATFRSLPGGDPEIAALRARVAAAPGSYLIASFQRDTLGDALTGPKLEKGPDVFAEIVGGLRRGGHRVHVVLAGPRRHWLRARLDALGVPWTFLGRPTPDDDWGSNALPRETLNRLYNLVDLCLVASRSEGGPHAVLEAAAAGCKVLSTPVGIAPDVLASECLYRAVPQAIATIADDIAHGTLGQYVERHRARVRDHHVPAAAEGAVRKLYEETAAGPPFAPAPRAVRPPRLVRRARAALRRLGWPVAEARRTVSLWNEFHAPPWGGGNQFMIALGKALRQQGMAVRENHLDADVHVLNAIWFDLERWRRAGPRGAGHVIHRIDGPVGLVRGFDEGKDEAIFALNRAIASATVLQSEWSLRRLLERGFEPVNPVVIVNGVDGDLFNRTGRVSFARDRKIRLIATSWSDNPRKGGPAYRWLEEHLDWSRFEFTFVGRCSEPLRRARHLDAVGSEALATLLKEHDIYVTASERDPCSNALLEALACGLPALYRNDGGHPELVGHGGLPFDAPEEIPARLDAIVEHYEAFQTLIAVPPITEVATRYLRVADEVAA
jgi:glycosyltransferase involved in cell wall biosynthesis